MFPVSRNFESTSYGRFRAVINRPHCASCLAPLSVVRGCCDCNCNNIPWRASGLHCCVEINERNPRAQLIRHCGCIFKTVTSQISLADATQPENLQFPRIPIVFYNRTLMSDARCAVNYARSRYRRCIETPRDDGSTEIGYQRPNHFCAARVSVFYFRRAEEYTIYRFSLGARSRKRVGDANR